MKHLGTAKGLVIRTGDCSFLGRLSNLTSSVSTDDALIVREIARFIYIITGIAIFLGIFFFFIALSLGYPFSEAVIFLVAVIVTNVPKGLLTSVTVNRDCWKIITNGIFPYFLL